MWHEFKDNLKFYWSYYSNWVVAIVSGVASYVLYNFGDVILMYPKAAAAAPALAIGAHVLAKGWPQPGLQAKLDKEELAKAMQAAADAAFNAKKP